MQCYINNNSPSQAGVPKHHDEACTEPCCSPVLLRLILPPLSYHFWVPPILSISPWGSVKQKGRASPTTQGMGGQGIPFIVPFIVVRGPALPHHHPLALPWRSRKRLTQPESLLPVCVRRIPNAEASVWVRVRLAPTACNISPLFQGCALRNWLSDTKRNLLRAGNLIYFFSFRLFFCLFFFSFFLSFAHANGKSSSCINSFG